MWWHHRQQWQTWPSNPWLRSSPAWLKSRNERACDRHKFGTWCKLLRSGHGVDRVWSVERECFFVQVPHRCGGAGGVGPLRMRHEFAMFCVACLALFIWAITLFYLKTDCMTRKPTPMRWLRYPQPAPVRQLRLPPQSLQLPCYESTQARHLPVTGCATGALTCE